MKVEYIDSLLKCLPCTTVVQRTNPSNKLRLCVILGPLFDKQGMGSWRVLCRILWTLVHLANQPAFPLRLKQNHCTEGCMINGAHCTMEVNGIGKMEDHGGHAYWCSHGSHWEKQLSFGSSREPIFSASEPIFCQNAPNRFKNLARTPEQNPLPVGEKGVCVCVCE